LLDERSHVALLLEDRKEDFLRVLLVATNGAKGGQAVSGEVALIFWLDTRGIVVDGIESANANVGEEFPLNLVRSGTVRVEVAVCWAGDRNKREAILIRTVSLHSGSR